MIGRKASTPARAVVEPDQAEQQTGRMTMTDSHFEQSSGRVETAGTPPGDPELPTVSSDSSVSSDSIAPSDSVEQFTQDLRQLRHANGFPKLTTMQFHTGISKSTISAALKGDRLPSEKTVRALANYFSADAEDWSRRRSVLDRNTPHSLTDPEVDFNPTTGLMETPPQPEDEKAGSSKSDELPMPRYIHCQAATGVLVS